MKILIFWTKFPQKVYLYSKTDKANITIEFSVIWIILSTKFQLKLTIMNFWTKFAQKGHFWLKKGRANIAMHWILHIWINLCIKFNLKLTILRFWQNLLKNSISNLSLNWTFCFDRICLKRLFLVENRKSEDHHWILHILVILDTKFRPELSILNFWSKIAQ